MKLLKNVVNFFNRQDLRRSRPSNSWNWYEEAQRICMPLKGIPKSITPELLFALARMGHGDTVVIADSNFPSDATAACTVIKVPIRVSGSTSEVLKDVLSLIPLDAYSTTPVCVMDRVQSDKDKNLEVVAYESISIVIQTESEAELHKGNAKFGLTFVERFKFYDLAKDAFCIVQTTDTLPYANVLVSKGVL